MYINYDTVVTLSYFREGSTQVACVFKLHLYLSFEGKILVVLGKLTKN